MAMTPNTHLNVLYHRVCLSVLHQHSRNSYRTIEHGLSAGARGGFAIMFYTKINLVIFCFKTTFTQRKVLPLLYCKAFVVSGM